MVDVLVQVYDRGQIRREVVQVEEVCFTPGHLCWKPIAAMTAAVAMELSFVTVEKNARYGLRPEDRARLREMYGGSRGDGGAQCAPLQETGNTPLIQPFGPPSPEGEGLRVRAGETNVSLRSE
jgi:hypothetical protein